MIALTGASASGKSTLAGELVKSYGFTKVRFAQPVKDMLMALGLSALDVDGPQDHRRAPHPLLGGKSPRYALQTLGTAWRDMIDRQLWARITVQRIQDEVARGRSWIVIDDLRFHHELELLIPFNPVVISVRRSEVEPTPHQLWLAEMRPSVQRVARIMGMEIPHVSETEWLSLPYDYSIRNDGDVDELKYRLDFTMDRVLRSRQKLSEDTPYEAAARSSGQLLA